MRQEEKMVAVLQAALRKTLQVNSASPAAARRQRRVLISTLHELR